MFKQLHSLPTLPNYNVLYSLNPRLFKDPTWLFTQNESKNSAINKLFSSSTELLQNVLKNNIIKLLDASGDSKALFIEKLFKLQTPELKAIFNKNLIGLIKVSGDSKGFFLKKLVTSSGKAEEKNLAKILISLLKEAASKDEQNDIISQLLNLDQNTIKVLLTKHVTSEIISCGKNKYGASPISYDQAQKYKLEIADAAKNALLEEKFTTASSFPSIQELYKYQNHTKFAAFYKKNVLKWVKNSLLDTELVKKLPKELKTKIFTTDIIKQIVAIDPYVLESEILKTAGKYYQLTNEKTYIKLRYESDNQDQFIDNQDQFICNIKKLLGEKTDRNLVKAEMKQQLLKALEYASSNHYHYNLKNLSEYLFNPDSGIKKEYIQYIMTPNILARLIQDGINRNYMCISIKTINDFALEIPCEIDPYYLSVEYKDQIQLKQAEKAKQEAIELKEFQAKEALKCAQWIAEYDAKVLQEEKEAEEILKKHFNSIEEAKELTQTAPLIRCYKSDVKVSDTTKSILSKTYYHHYSTFLRQNYAVEFAQKIENLMESNHYIKSILKHAASNYGAIIIFDKYKVANIYRSETLEVKGRFDSLSNQIYIAHTSYQTVDFEVKTFIHEATHKLISNKYQNFSKPYLLLNYGQADHVDRILKDVMTEHGSIANRLKLYPTGEHASEILSIFVDEVVMKQKGNQCHTRTATEEQLFELLDSTLDFQACYETHDESHITGDVGGYWSVP